MEKTMQYETLFAVDVTLGEEAVRAIVDKFTALIAQNGTIVETNEWGKRKFAYEIDYKSEGYYVLVKFTSGPEFPAELQRVFNITEGVMRAIVVKEAE